MTELYIYIPSFIITLILDLLITATKAGLLNVNVARLLAQRDEMQSQVQNTFNLVNSTPRLRACLSLAHSLVKLLLVGLTLLLIYQISAIASIAVYLGIAIISIWLIFWVEWIVEGYIAQNPEAWAVRLTPVGRVLIFVLTPLAALPLSISKHEESTPEGTVTITEDELKIMVDASQENGILELEERKMIHSIFDLGNTLAREIMVPRIDLMAIDIRTPLSDAVDTLLSSGYSRVPVYSESVDNILGLLYAKDLLRFLREGKQTISIRDLLKPAYFVPEAKKVDELLNEMQKQRIHLAIVVDEYGGVAGVVTLEDIVEEILGEIQDEFDHAEELSYQEISEDEYLFLGRIDLDDFNDITSSSLPTDESDTLAGFLYSRIGRVPTGGETVREENLTLTIEQISGRRIRKVRVKRVSPPPLHEEESHADK